MKTHIDKALKDESGLTLVDIAIALMVIGLLVAPLVQTYHLRQKEIEKSNTNASINAAQAAVNQFFFDNDRYPCPADPTLNTTNANYGQEDCSGTNPNIPVAPAGANNVYIGAVPFQTLKLTPKQALDAWNHKITYAVTDILTNVATYNPGLGAISIQKPAYYKGPDQCSIPGVDAPQPPVTNVHYALLSMGKTGAGAYTADGAQPTACPNGGTLDGENCDNDILFFYPECLYSEVAGASFYDDIFLTDNDAIVDAPTKMWDTGTNPTDVGFASSGFIGIGNPDPQAQLDVIGNIRADSVATDPTKLGQSQASDYCDDTGANCFNTNTIAGNDPNMQCANDTGISGIANSSARCSTVIPSATAATCPAGQYVQEITSAGAIICATPP